MKTTTKDGAQIDYAVSGEGDPTLVLCPAWCMSRNGFAHLPERLAKNHRIIEIDWRGHGASPEPAEDFGADQLVEDALAAIEASGAQTVIPITLSHAGWVAIELAKRIGKERVPKIINLDWVVLPPPPMYMDLVHALATPEGWQGARDILFGMWLEGVTDPEEISFVRDEMGGVSGEMWQRSGREIGACIEQGGYPLAALAQLDPPVPAIHIYAQPPDPGYYDAQVDFGKANPWFQVHRLSAHSHFPTFEMPDEIATVIEDFLAQDN
ncbi:1H-3-hydroxy-4-oxoquinaldine 2,4-dioxygenase [Abditibacteriota bacterium]|nr:1H-3-hydroxy-4-oxoquinaldine 2,4-dioxygenase [Abditibacteriota bacterium]